MTRFSFLLFVLLLSFPVISSAQFVNFEETWYQFLKNENASNLSQLKKPSESNKLDYAKYHLMYATVDFCNGELTQAQNEMKEIDKVTPAVYTTIKGFEERYESLKGKVTAAKKTDYIWYNFLEYGQVTSKDLADLEKAKTVCDKATLAKYNMMLSYAHFCEGEIEASKEYFNNRLSKLIERTSLQATDVAYLPEQMKNMVALYKSAAALDEAWQSFLKTGASNGFDGEMSNLRCDLTPAIKISILKANKNICEYGKENLATIDEYLAANRKPLDQEVIDAVDKLQQQMLQFNGNENELDAAWRELSETDTVITDHKYYGQYCDPEDQLKAYLIQGNLFACESGDQMIKKIQQTQMKHKFALTGDLEVQMNRLVSKVDNYTLENIQFDTIWQTFLMNNDTLAEGDKLEKFYCNQTHQIKSWIMKANSDVCKLGERFLDAIDKLVNMEKLELEEDVTCSIARLRRKTWDCQFADMEIKARAAIDVERNDFLDASAQVMQLDLNEGKTSCKVRVESEALGELGMQYILEIPVCDGNDLPENDPDLYQKIKEWIDIQILPTYCSGKKRCGDEMDIFIDAHVSQSDFKPIRLKEDLNIPTATAFDYIETNGEASYLETVEPIKNYLQVEMEAGIAYGWTIQQQLDALKLPVALSVTEIINGRNAVFVHLNFPNLFKDLLVVKWKEIAEAEGLNSPPEGCER